MLKVLLVNPVNVERSREGKTESGLHEPKNVPAR